MIIYEDRCVGCASDAYPCQGSSCGNRNVPVLVCDKCENEVDELYWHEGDQLCIECIKDMFVVVNPY